MNCKIRAYRLRKDSEVQEIWDEMEHKISVEINE